MNKFKKFNDTLEKKLKKDTKDIGSISFKEMGKITEYIPSGNYLLNAQLSGSLFGGAANARSLEIAGAPGTGKSFICMNMAREATKMGYFVYYIDTEGAMEKDDMIKFGSVEGMYQYVRTIKTFSQFKRFMSELMEQKKDPEYADEKVMVFLDSYGMLMTDKELQDLAKGKNAQDMGLRAKEGRQLFKIITLEMSNMSIPFVFTNHTGAKIDLFGGTKIGGGDGPTYAASAILKLGKGSLKTGTVKTGIVVYSETEKNRLAKPVGIEFHISFHKGMNPFVGLQNHANWETCGVQKGTLMEADEYEKVVSKNTIEGKKLKSRRAEPFKHEGKDYVAVLYDTAKTYVIRSEAKLVDARKYFTPEVFTLETLKELDEKVIQPTFKYRDIGEVNEDEYNDIMDMGENNEIDEPGDVLNDE